MRTVAVVKDAVDVARLHYSDLPPAHSSHDRDNDEVVKRVWTASKASCVHPHGAFQVVIRTERLEVGHPKATMEQRDQGLKIQHWLTDNPHIRNKHPSQHPTVQT